MTVDTNTLVAMTEANRNFSKVVHIVDDEGIAVIMKNNKPRYVVVGFDEYEEIRMAMAERRRKVTETAEGIMDEFDGTFKELAK